MVLTPNTGVRLRALSTRLAIICAGSSLSLASGSKTSRRVTSVLPSSSAVGTNASAASRVRLVTILAAFAAIKIGAASLVGRFQGRQIGHDGGHVRFVYWGLVGMAHLVDLFLPDGRTKFGLC
jgi:hypothetical protein